MAEDNKQAVHFSIFGIGDINWKGRNDTLFYTPGQPRLISYGVRGHKDNWMLRKHKDIYGFDRPKDPEKWLCVYEVGKEVSEHFPNAREEHSGFCFITFLKEYDGVKVSKEMAPEIIAKLKEEYALDDLVTLAHINPDRKPHWMFCGLNPVWGEAPRIDLRALPSYKPGLSERLEYFLGRGSKKLR